MADPPYDMRERQQQPQQQPQQQRPQPQPQQPQIQKQSQPQSLPLKDGGEGEETEGREEAELIVEGDGTMDEGGYGTTSEREVGLLNVDRPDSVVVSLLTLAAASLRPGGRLVFFYPHRHSRLASGLTSMTTTTVTTMTGDWHMI